MAKTKKNGDAPTPWDTNHIVAAFGLLLPRYLSLTPKWRRAMDAAARVYGDEKMDSQLRKEAGYAMHRVLIDGCGECEEQT